MKGKCFEGNVLVSKFNSVILLDRTDICMQMTLLRQREKLNGRNDGTLMNRGAKGGNCRKCVCTIS